MSENNLGHCSLSVFLCSSTCFIRIYGFISHTLSVAPDAVVETCRDAMWMLCDH